MFDQVTKAAAQCTDYHHRLGALCLDRKGKVISAGHNKRKTHPLQARHAKRQSENEKIYLHAEIAALVKCREQPHTVVVCRLRKHGIGLAKPCPICIEAMYEAGVQVVKYSTNEGTFVERKVVDLRSKV